MLIMIPTVATASFLFSSETLMMVGFMLEGEGLLGDVCLDKITFLSLTCDTIRALSTLASLANGSHFSEIRMVRLV